jgi:hypothetical protein
MPETWRLLMVHEASPDGLHNPRVPSEEDRRGLAPGAVVRVVHRRVDEQEPDREVWVEITARLEGNMYQGKVAVQPESTRWRTETSGIIGGIGRGDGASASGCLRRLQLHTFLCQGLGIREIEPLLEEVDPQHLLEPPTAGAPAQPTHRTTPRPATPHATNQLSGFPDLIRVFHEENPEFLDPLRSGAPGKVETPLPARRRREPGGGGWSLPSRVLSPGWRR